MINEVFNYSGDGMTTRDWICGALGALGFFSIIWGINLLAIGFGLGA